MNDEDSCADNCASRAYATAVRILANRDHSTAELTRKLEKRSFSSAAIHSAINELRQANYIDDRRYACDYAEQRMNKGYGPLSVRRKLLERGLDTTLIENALTDQTVVWSDLAQSVIKRHFDEGQMLSTDQKDESRIARFLKSRGFSGSDSLKALLAVRKELIACHKAAE